MLSLDTLFPSRPYTDENLLDLREPMRLLDARDRSRRVRGEEVVRALLEQHGGLRSLAKR